MAGKMVLANDNPAVLNQFARSLTRFGATQHVSLAAVQSLDQVPIVYTRGSDLCRDPGNAPEILVAGWGCLMRPEPKRRRQIIGFFLPGDVVGSFYRSPEFQFCARTALTRVTTVSARSFMALDVLGRPVHSEVLSAARRAQDYRQHLLIDHIVRLGARDAYAGLAHLLLELNARLEAAGLSCDGAFRLPVGQRVLAQALGLSVAHTNNTLRRMTDDGLFCITGSEMQLLDMAKMAALSGFALAASQRVAPSTMERLRHEPYVQPYNQEAQSIS